jgi:tetratricopeptide (TPR) repeat protein
MSEAERADDLDRRAARLRSSAAAARGTDDEAEPLLELADVLAARYQSRLAVADLAGADADLTEWSSRLEEFLARIEVGHPAYPAVLFGAGSASYECWIAARDPAVLDAAIRHTRACLASTAIWGSGTDDAETDHAGADPEAIIELRILLGFALSDRFLATRWQLDPGDEAGIAVARADRDHSVGQLRLVFEALDSADPRRLEVADVLGRMRHDCYDDPWPGPGVPDPADVDAAIDLLTQVAAGEPDCRSLWYLVLALADRVNLRSAPADQDALITWGLRLLDHPDATGADIADVHDLLGRTLLDRAEERPHRRQPDLDAAIAHLEAALAAASPDATGRTGLLELLAHAWCLRTDGDASRYDDIDKMIGYAKQAWRTGSSADEVTPMTGVYLAAGLQERLRRPGQPFEMMEVNLAIEVLEWTEPQVADEPDVHLTVVVLLGQFLVARGQEAGSTADLVAAQPWLLAAADKLPAADPQSAEVTQILATSMFLLASMGMGADNLDRAIALLTASVQNPGSEHAAMTRGALGMALVTRAAFAARRRDLDDGIAHLEAAYSMLAAGDVRRIELAFNLGSSLLIRFTQNGNIRDRDAARFYLEAGDVAGPIAVAVGDLTWARDMTVAAMRGLLALAEGMRDDPAALDRAVEHLRAALAQAPSGHPYRERIRSDLGLALAMRAAGGRDTATDFAAATEELEAALAELPPGHIMRDLALMRVGACRAAAAHTARSAKMMREAIRYLTHVLDEIGPKPDFRVRMLAVLGVAQKFLHELTADRADLADAVTWLTEASDEFAGQPGHPEHATTLIQLAHVYRTRGDNALARETGLATLRARGREVLLQTGTARSLGFARMAAAEATDIASWCLADDNPAAAVDALELGRGLVLHAATSGTDVPAMLAAAGRADLAAEWREQAGSQDDRPWDAGLSGTDYVGRLLAGDVPLEVPDDLRARVLTALGGSAGEKLRSPPSRAQIAAALARTGSDALVYLLEPAGDQPGCAILIPAGDLAVGARPQVLPLPRLRSSAGAISSYAAAYAGVLSAAPPAGGHGDLEYERWKQGRERVVGQWRQSLATLCAWAWPTVMGPVLEHVGKWGLHRPPRLVLIPAGRLSLVPWHAAFGRPPGAAAGRHACSDAVLSYAASCRQFVQVTRRPAVDLQDAPVIVGNPTFDLTFAGLEAQAIWLSCYPAGRFFGYVGPAAEVTAEGPGKPGEVLGLLPTASGPGASMVHLGCHADVVGSAPGQSYLLLAGHEKLMIEAILRQAAGRPPLAPGGLVSLAACRSDLAAEEYDEALTLATAFLAAGAVTVVGARWEVPDGATSLLMFMFHHFMTSGGAEPRDALRMAQLWMLDPARAAPPEMPEHLARHAAGTELADIATWAALTHQGR